MSRGRRSLHVTGLAQGRGNHRVGKLIHFVGVGDNKPQLTEGLSVTDVELGCVMGEDHDREQREHPGNVMRLPNLKAGPQ